MIPDARALFDVNTHYVTNQPNSQNDGALPETAPCGGWRTGGSCHSVSRHRREAPTSSTPTQGRRLPVTGRGGAGDSSPQTARARTGGRSSRRDVRAPGTRTTRFQRLLVRKLAEKLPLPWDIKLEAIVRGIQVVGIWMWVVQELPLEDCPCLQMMGGAELKARIEQEIRELLEATQRDLERAA